MISILFPSAGRPHLFRQALQSLRDTTKKHDIEIIAVIDECFENVETAKEFDAALIDFSSTKRGALWAWNRCLFHSDGDIIVPAGDDQIFHEGWLDYALRAHSGRLNKYGVVGMNDLAYDGNLQVATMFLFDRKYCREIMGGVFAPPMYNYYCIDLEWNDKAKLLGRFVWEDRSRVEHVHSAHGKRPLDQLDQEKMDSGWMEIDNQIFQDRKSRDFPIEWEPII